MGFVGKWKFIKQVIRVITRKNRILSGWGLIPLEMLSFDPASNSDRKNGATLLFWTNMAKIITKNLKNSDLLSETCPITFSAIILAMLVQNNNVAPFFWSEFDAGSNESISKVIRLQPDEIRFFRVITRITYLMNFHLPTKPIWHNFTYT